MNLRPYQITAVSGILNEWGRGCKRTLLVLPTGTGKTIVFSYVTLDRVTHGHRVLILAHREELLKQAADKLKKSCGLNAVFEQAGSTAYGSNVPVTVGSVQTLCRDARLNKFPSNYYDEIIIDEAHHCLSTSYRKIIDHFNTANLLGVTATPDRGDRRKLGEIFESTAFEYPMSRAITDGYLCPIVAQMLPLKIDIAGVGETAGDYNDGELGTALMPYLKEIGKQMKRYCSNRKTVVFLPLIKTSQAFCEILNELGFRAAEVNGESPDRAEILQAFEDGEYNVLCNSMLLTEGWDCPSVDCIIVLRPTKIRSLYQQMVGRGTRLSQGKKNLLLLDFLWMTERHELCKPSDIFASSREIAEQINTVLETGEEIDLMKAAEEANKKNEEQIRNQALARILCENSDRKARTVNPISYAVSIDSIALMNYQPQYAWEEDAPTEKQLGTLERWGFARSDIPSKGYAAKLIAIHTNRSNAKLATAKQINTLERYGYKNVKELTVEQAHEKLNELEKNKWQRLPN